MIEKPSKPMLNPMEDFANGALSSTCAISATHPIATIKNYKQCGKKFLDGKAFSCADIGKLFREVYRGIIPNASSGALSEGFAFTVYGLGKERLKDNTGKLSKKNNFILSTLGALAGAPVNTVCERFMILKQLHGGSIGNYIKTVNPFKGLKETSIRDTGFNIGVFAGNDAVKGALKPYINDPLTHEISSGLLSGCAIGWLTTPIDGIKTRLQGDLTGKYKTFTGTANHIIQKDGIRGLWYGAGARTAMVGSLICITAILKERIPYLFHSSTP